MMLVEEVIHVSNLIRILLKKAESMSKGNIVTINY